MLSAVALLFGSCMNFKETRTIDKSTITHLELNKYMGTWYEIARYPHRFEKDLEGVTATYELLDNGMIKVTNSGYKIDGGKKKEAFGKAKMPDLNEPGKLKVSFFLFFYADYYILEIEPDAYNWVLIGSKSDNYLWILSRTPLLDEQLYKTLITKLRSRGYDIDKLERVSQEKNLVPRAQEVKIN
jgi:lipocalin